MTSTGRGAAAARRRSRRTLVALALVLFARVRPDSCCIVLAQTTSPSSMPTSNETVSPTDTALSLSPSPVLTSLPPMTTTSPTATSSLPAPSQATDQPSTVSPATQSPAPPTSIPTGLSLPTKSPQPSQFPSPHPTSSPTTMGPSPLPSSVDPSISAEVFVQRFEVMNKTVLDSTQEFVFCNVFSSYTPILVSNQQGGIPSSVDITTKIFTTCRVQNQVVLSRRRRKRRRIRTKSGLFEASSSSSSSSSLEKNEEQQHDPNEEEMLDLDNSFLRWVDDDEYDEYELDEYHATMNSTADTHRDLQAVSYIIQVDYRMQYSSRHIDTSTFPDDFKTYVNSNLTGVANDLKTSGLPILSAQLALSQPQPPPSSSVVPTVAPTSAVPSDNTESFVQRFEISRSVLFNDTEQVIFCRVLEGYTPFLASWDGTIDISRINTTCTFKSQAILTTNRQRRWHRRGLRVRLPVTMMTHINSFLCWIGWKQEEEEEDVNRHSKEKEIGVTAVDTTGTTTIYHRNLQSTYINQVDYSMRYVSRHVDTTEYPNDFKNYINMNLVQVTSDMVRNGLQYVISAEQVFSQTPPTPAPTPPPTFVDPVVASEAFVQRFEVESNNLFNTTQQMEFCQVFEGYTQFLVSVDGTTTTTTTTTATNGAVDATRIETTCEVKRQASLTRRRRQRSSYVGGDAMGWLFPRRELSSRSGQNDEKPNLDNVNEEERNGESILLAFDYYTGTTRNLQVTSIIQIDYTIQYISRFTDTSSLPEAFKTFVNGNLTRVAEDMRSVGLPVVGAEIVFSQTAEQTPSPTQAPSTGPTEMPTAMSSTMSPTGGDSESPSLNRYEQSSGGWVLLPFASREGQSGCNISTMMCMVIMSATSGLILFGVI